VAHISHEVDDAGGHGAAHHGISHVASIKVLLGTFGALIFLTLLTVVTATQIHLGSQGNLILALFIATFKATLVCTFFMHLKYDKPMNTIILAAALLFSLLFIAFTLMDSNQYQPDTVYKNDNLSPTLMNEQLK
jgi:cytochrome c oxidase subunit 4